MSENPDLTGKPEADAKHRPEAHPAAGSSGAPSETETDPDFVISEAHEEAPELVGGFKADRRPDDLGIESPADIMEHTAHRGQTEHPEAFNLSESDLIGDSQPPTPLPSGSDGDQTTDESDFGAIKSNIEAPDEPGRIEKLSDEKLKEISARMRAETESATYLSEEEKLQLLHSIDTAAPHKGFDNLPIVPPRKKEKPIAQEEPVELTGERPQIAKRVRGVAYFAKGFIQIKGEQELHEMDELTINGREYLLRKKKVSSKMIAAVAAPLAAVVIFALGTMFSTGADTGQGRIVGMVLDEYDQPMIAGAAIGLPDLGKRYEVNGQGFFKTDQIPAGSYRVEYIVAGEVVGTDYATVADGQLTTFSIRPSPTPASATSPANQTPSAQQITSSAVTTPAATSAAPTRTVAQSNSNSNTPGGSAGASKDQWARITLAANVDGAKLILDNKVVGAGNLTYPKLQPGTHTYLVTKDGFEPADGKLKLVAGETYSLSVNLKPLPRKDGPKSSPDGYTSGLTALQNGDYATAVQEFDKAIAQNPRHSDAYLKRAEALVQLGRRGEAADDYVKSGDLLNAANHPSDAIAAFDKAIELNPKATAGYLGRGRVYLERGEAIAAIADFDMVVRIDKRSVGGYLGLGEARYRQGYFEKATKHFKDARSIEADNPTIYQFLMLSYMGEGDLKQVKKCYEKFLELANQEQAQRLNSDPKYAAALQAIDH